MATLTGPVFSAEDIRILNAVARAADGRGQSTDDAGAAGDTLVRLTEASYDDGIGEMPTNAANPRDVSNKVMQQTTDTPDPGGASDFLWAWGQFVDHDLSLTEAHCPHLANIPVPEGDPAFDLEATGTKELIFNRVKPIDGTGVDTPREYANDITAFLDGSHIYGSSDEVLSAMRADGGKLHMVDDMLESEDGELLTGDARAAENVALSSMHTLFTREHNRIVEELAEKNDDLSDDELFNAARAQVEGIMQAITYNEFLPRLLGDEALHDYDGYDAEVNPQVSVEFSTAVYRFGHSLLSSKVLRLNEDGSEHESGHMELKDAFFNLDELAKSGVCPVLRGLGEGKSQALDTQVIEDVRSFLFANQGEGGMDLAAINIQRGHDLGIPSYNDLRVLLGLKAAEGFADITSDEDLAAQLEEAYGDVSSVDAWVGGLAEDPVNGGMVGETFSTVMVDQFTRVRDGDPMWIGNRGLSSAAYDEIWSTTLSDVILRNTEIEFFQTDAFKAFHRIGGSKEDDILEGESDSDLIGGLEGDDALFGRGGDDEIFGGDGNDYIKGGSGGDILHGEDGRDYLMGGRGDDVIHGGAGRDMLHGQTGDDTLRGGADSDRMFGAKGDDVLHGDEGHDELRGGQGDDTLYGGKGNDTLRGGQMDDHLEGGDGDDHLRGGRGDDILMGGDGDDYLRGHKGNDVLTGGSGKDHFDLRGKHSGHDEITDFEVGDTIDLGKGTWAVEKEDDILTVLSADRSVKFYGLTEEEEDELLSQISDIL